MKIVNPIALAVLVWCIFSCGEKKQQDRTTDLDIRKHAEELAGKFLIVDGHVDLPYLVKEKKWLTSSEYPGVLSRTTVGEFDFERSVKGGLDAPFMSIYIPSYYQQHTDYGKSLADSLINLVLDVPRQLPTQFALANSPEDVRSNTTAGKISLPMGMENGAPIGLDKKNIQYFFDRGIRYITLTHSKYNQIWGSSGDTVTTHMGLTAFGREVVREMNRVGIMIDISHVDDSTFYQVMKLSKVPCIASHSSCRYFAPMVKRDMTDDMIRKLADNGGVVLINFYSGFLDSAANRGQKKIGQLLKERKLNYYDSLAIPILEQFKKDFPVDTGTVANHIDHVVKVAGVDHVGFGSDFDGVDGLLPSGLEDVSMFPNLIFALLKRGYSDADIEKICGGNALRVWQAALDASKH